MGKNMSLLSRFCILWINYLYKKVWIEVFRFRISRLWKLSFYPCEKYKTTKRKAMQVSAFLFPLTGSNTKRDLDLDLRMHYLHQCPPDWPTGESENYEIFLIFLSGTQDIIGNRLIAIILVYFDLRLSPGFFHFCPPIFLFCSILRDFAIR